MKTLIDPRNLFTLFALALAAVSVPVSVHAQNGVLSTEMNPTQGQFTVYYVPFSSPNFFEQNLYQQVYTSGGTTFGSPTQVTGIGGTPPVGSASPLGIATYFNTIDGANQIYYLFTASPGVTHVEQIYTGGSGDLTQNVGAEPAAANSDLVGFIDSCANTDNLFYIGADQHVHLLTWGPGATGWSTEDLTSLTGTPNATGGALTGHFNSHTNMSEEVFYIDSNNQVHELWRWSGCNTAFDGWHATDLYYANSAGGPAPAAGSSLVNFGDYGADLDKVIYVGTDQHVHQYVFSFAASTWSNVDLTAAASAANVGAGKVLTAHENSIAGSEEVFFVDGESNIEELWAWSYAPTVWYKTVAPYGGAPAVFSAGPLQTAIAANVNSLNGTDDFYYVGSNGDLYQISWVHSWSLSALATLVEPPYNN